MIFNSFQFLLFLPIAVTVYFLTPHRWRWATTLLLSYYFYMCWKPAFVLLIIASTVIDYLVGIGLDRTDSVRRRRILLGTSLTANLGLLFTFKYLDFACQSVEHLLAAAGLLLELPHPELVLPVGISFYTFQTLSYTIDVYRRATPTEYHLGRFAVYVSFFPQLVAGPIERSNRLLPQFRQPCVPKPADFSIGFRLILLGLFKKMCVADLVAVPVNRIFANPELYDGSLLVLAAVFFAVQIYCDFSGYSDIAIGTAQLLGIRLMTNFRQPYFAQSIGEFWQRWHISLSTWFRDYVYIPLGGNRVTSRRWACNIFITFIVSGVWHGAAWTFVVWGCLHACYFLLERMANPVLSKLATVIGANKVPGLQVLFRVTVTFILVDIAWVFFRAPTLHEALVFLGGMLDWSNANVASLDTLGLQTVDMALCFIMPLILLVIDVSLFVQPAFLRRLWGQDLFRTAVYVAGIYAILLLGIFDSVDFIYFQF